MATPSKTMAETLSENAAEIPPPGQQMAPRSSQRQYNSSGARNSNYRRDSRGYNSYRGHSHRPREDGRTQDYYGGSNRRNDSYHTNRERRDVVNEERNNDGQETVTTDRAELKEEEDQKAQTSSITRTFRKVYDWKNHESKRYRDGAPRHRYTHDSQELSDRQSEEIRRLKEELSAVKLKQTETDQLLLERTAELSSAQTFLGNADRISLAEVGNMVELLNAEILQTAAFIADSLTYEAARHTREDQHEINGGFNEVGRLVGSDLPRILFERITEPKLDPVTAQITLQAGLVAACTLIIRQQDSQPVLHDTYNAIRESKGQTIAGRWRALAYEYMKPSEEGKQDKDMNWMLDILRNLLTSIGWSLRGPDAHVPTKYKEKLMGVVESALKLQVICRRDVTSADLMPNIISSNSPFDNTRMTYAYGEENDINTDERVICTVEMGLGCGKMVVSNKADEAREETSVILKPKVALTSTFTMKN
ncbi:hypothetical protein AX17_006136 [Amanita inopinata Kibby_2008]|nr:hypothetical protein AX17_006136 [Amanita inopinata Kibby_2008]